MLKSFEIEVLRELVSAKLGTDLVESVIRKSIQSNYEHTGCGYFLTLSHPELPANRVTCHLPIVEARTDRFSCGFVVFVEHGELTLECHSWDGGNVPGNFRDMNVRVSVKR